MYYSVVQILFEITPFVILTTIPIFHFISTHIIQLDDTLVLFNLSCSVNCIISADVLISFLRQLSSYLLKGVLPCLLR